MSTMTMRGPYGAGPTVPTPPTGFAVAAYPTYSQAARAVEYLAKQDFSVQDLSIVGSDLQSVERVTGRLTPRKLATAAAASGAWMGLFLGLVMSFFTKTASFIVLVAITVALGALFGAAMGLVGYFVIRGRRDFMSASQMVAHRYDLLCEARTAESARAILARWEMTGQAA